MKLASSGNSLDTLMVMLLNWLEDHRAEFVRSAQEEGDEHTIGRWDDEPNVLVYIFCSKLEAAFKTEFIPAMGPNCFFSYSPMLLWRLVNRGLIIPSKKRLTHNVLIAGKSSSSLCINVQLLRYIHQEQLEETANSLPQ